MIQLIQGGILPQILAVATRLTIQRKPMRQYSSIAYIIPLVIISDCPLLSVLVNQRIYGRDSNRPLLW